MHEQRVVWPTVIMLSIVGMLLLFLRDPETGWSATGLRYAACVVACVCLFLAQGYLAAWTAAIGALFISIPDNGSSVERAHACMMLASIGATMWIWASLNKPEFRPKFWILTAVVVVTLQTFTWIEIGCGDDSDALSRVRWVTLALPVIGGLLGIIVRLFLAKRSAKAILTGMGVTLLGPVLAFGIALPTVGARLMSVRPGPEWKSFPGQFSTWFNDFTDGMFDPNAWTWTMPVVVAALLALAVIQRFWWGFTELRAMRRLPFSWLLLGVWALILVLLSPSLETEPSLAREPIMWVGWMASTSAVVEVFASFGRKLQRTVPTEPDQE